MPHKLAPGQKLWLPAGQFSRNPHDGSEIEIEKVGRLYASIKRSRSRVRLSDLTCNNRRCYLSREEHAADIALSRSWREFVRAVDRPFWPPNGVTLEVIRQAYDLLHIPPPTPSQETK